MTAGGPDRADNVEEAAAPSQLATPSQGQPVPPHPLRYGNLEEGLRQLPAYAQSLLRVPVPVTVTLAATKASVSEILEIRPGTVLQFKQASDSKLVLHVGRQTVAEGEAVKVDDKFGLRITAMKMPTERFWTVNNSATKKRVK